MHRLPSSSIIVAHYSFTKSKASRQQQVTTLQNSSNDPYLRRTFFCPTLSGEIDFHRMDRERAHIAILCAAAEYFWCAIAKFMIRVNHPSIQLAHTQK
jgi:hypothetical protein